MILFIKRQTLKNEHVFTKHKSKINLEIKQKNLENKEIKNVVSYILKLYL